MNKRVGLLGVLLAAAVGLFHPAVASAQYRDDYRGNGRQEYRRNDHREREWRDAREWRDDRDRRDWREHAWREHERYERRYVPVYPSAYPYNYRRGYRAPSFGFEWYGR